MSDNKPHEAGETVRIKDDATADGWLKPGERAEISQVIGSHLYFDAEISLYFDTEVERVHDVTDEQFDLLMNSRLPASVLLGDDEPDLVNHPPHYDRFDGVQPLDIAKHLSFPLGSVLKYIARAGHKDGADELQDLLKAQAYLNVAIELAKQKSDA